MNSLKLVESDHIATAQTTEQTPSNITATVNKIESLSALENNWDSYNALAPSKKALIGSCHLAYELLNENTPLPEVFPVPNSNIQFEWSCHGLDIEIEIVSMSKCHVSYENIQTNECWEKVFTYDLTEVTKILTTLTNLSLESTKQPRLRIVR